MAYFTTKQPPIERACKVAADIFCVIVMAILLIVYFGWLAGLLGVVVLQAAIISVDWLVPDPDAADGAGVVR
jgi:hypothetical protein